MTDETAPTEFTPPSASAEPTPTPTVAADDATHEHPAGSAAPDPPPVGSSTPAAGLLDDPKVAQTVDQRPEVLVGGAFAGGLLFAMILKRLGR